MKHNSLIRQLDISEAGSYLTAIFNPGTNIL